MDITTMEINARKNMGSNESNESTQSTLPVFEIHDGPPFATGAPHYGHILTMTVKDIVARFKKMNGFLVPRRFGWDCHGLPIEFEIEKRLGLKTREDIEAYGIEKYCQACRDIVLECVDLWHDVYERMSCQPDDLDNPYMTMSNEYIQSVWSVMAKLHRQGLIYQGYKVMPYSVGCATPLSNFEVAQGYKEVTDTSATVLFRLDDESALALGFHAPVFLAAWTTTPWSLVSNQALCVNPDETYCAQKYYETTHGIKYSEYYVLTLRDKADVMRTTVVSFMGKELEGLSYHPLFPFQKEKQDTFQVLADTYVTTETGTGVVHLAPMFGEDDYRVCLKHSVITQSTRFDIPYTDNGYLKQEYLEFFDLPGKPELQHLQFFTKVNKFVLKKLEYTMAPYKTQAIKHNYPHCWRSKLPLMYRAVSCWFVDVDQLRPDMLKVISQINWVPDNIGTGRMYRWVADGKNNWCFSRDRYWGAPLPIWTNGEETLVVSNAMELVKHSAVLDGEFLTEELAATMDLHRPTLDRIKVPAKNPDQPPLSRVPQVFDCWFESGSMPYATGQVRPRADFIAEGVDQTRGWFYTLLVLSTALNKEPAFDNAIVTGIILAEDGRKMSKSEKNYRPITEILDDVGADAVRLYISQTKATKAEEVKVDYKGIKQMVQKFHIPLTNIVKLLNEANSVEGTFNTELHLLKCQAWIMDECSRTYEKYLNHMKNYELWYIADLLKDLVDKLSRIFINLNKEHLLAGEQGTITTVQYVLASIAQMLAPFAPHLAEHLSPGIHSSTFLRGAGLEQKKDLDYMTALFSCLETIKSYRESVRGKTPGLGLGFKYPIDTVRMPASCCPVEMVPYVKSNCNVLHVELLSPEETSGAVTRKIEYAPNFKSLGRKFGKDIKRIKALLFNPTQEEFEQLLAGTYPDLCIDTDYTVKTTQELVHNESDTWHVTLSDSGIPMWISKAESDEQHEMYEKRMYDATVSQLRKAAGLKRSDAATVCTTNPKYVKYGATLKCDVCSAKELWLA